MAKTILEYKIRQARFLENTKAEDDDYNRG